MPDVAAEILRSAECAQVWDGLAATGRSILDAAALREACLAADPVRHPTGLRIAHAEIAGPLDLTATEVKVGLHFAGCSFTEPLRLDGADLQALAIVGGWTGPGFGARWPLAHPDASHLSGLYASGVRIRRDLDLSGTVVTGAHALTTSLSQTAAIWLTEAEIGGRVVARGASLEPDRGRAIQADRTRIAGDVRLIHGFRSTGEIRLIAAEIGGSLDLASATLTSRTGIVLDATDASIGGSFFIVDDPRIGVRPRLRGRIDMARASIDGRVLIRRARLDPPPAGSATSGYDRRETINRIVLHAPRIRVGGEFVLEDDCVVTGALVMPGAALAGGLSVTDSVLRNPEEVVLDLSDAEIGAEARLPGITVEGRINLSGAHIRGRLDLGQARLSRPRGRDCLIGLGARIDGDLALGGLRMHAGSIDLRSAVVSGVVDAERADLHNPGDRTISLHQARVGGSVRLCAGFRSVGLVVLNRVAVEGRLRFDGGTFTWRPSTRVRPGTEPNARGVAVEAISADVRAGIALGWQVTAGAVDLTNARTPWLADDPEHDWPVRSHMSGFAYERFAPLDMQEGHGVWDADRRARWLDRLEPYDPRPWEQLARVLHTNGDHRGAERVLIAQRRAARRRARPGWLTAGDWLADVTVRYGFRPQRAAFAIVLLVLAVAVSLAVPAGRATMRTTDARGVVYTADGAAGTPTCGGGEVRCFHPWWYAIDTVVPIIDLHQRSTWYPDSSALDAWLSISTVLGWILPTVFALSFTRLGRSP